MNTVSKNFYYLKSIYLKDDLILIALLNLCTQMGRKIRYSGNLSVRFWRQYVSLFASIAAAVVLLLTSDRKSSRWNKIQLVGVQLSFIFAITSRLCIYDFHFESISYHNWHCSPFLGYNDIFWTVNDHVLIIQDVMYGNLHFNWQTFATCLVHHMKWIAILYILCRKSIRICVISDINQVVHPKFLFK